MSQEDNYQTPGKPHQVDGLENDSTESIVDRLPDPISAHADAVITIVGKRFTDHTSWGSAVRLLLIVPPTLPQLPMPAFSLGDCLAWLETFSRKLAMQLAESRSQKPYRMIAALEGSPNRGWFYSLILDLPRAFSLKRFTAIIQSSKPNRLCLTYVGECDGTIEASHLIGRFGIAYLTEGA